MSRRKSKLFMVIMSLSLLFAIVPISPVSADLSDTSLTERMNEIHDALTDEEKISVSNAKDNLVQLIQPDVIMDHLSLVQEIWDKIAPKLVGVSEEDKDQITQENLLRLVSNLNFVYDPDGDMLEQLPGLIAPVVKQLASIAGVATDDLDWVVLEQFLLELESQAIDSIEAEYFTGGTINFSALSSVDEDELLEQLRIAYNNILEDTGTITNENVLKARDVLQFYGITSADVKAVAQKINQEIDDPSKAAIKSLLMAYIRTQSELELRSTSDDGTSKTYNYKILGNDVTYTQLAWTSSTDDVIVEIFEDTSQVPPEFMLKVSLADGVESAEATIEGTLEPLGTPLDGRIFIQADVSLEDTSSDLPTATPVVRSGSIGKVIEVVLDTENPENFSVSANGVELYYSPVREKFIGLFLISVPDNELTDNIIVTDTPVTNENYLYYGLINSDNSVTTGDAVDVVQIALGNLSVSSKITLAADVNNDLNVTTGDAVDVVQYALGNIVAFVVENN